MLRKPYKNDIDMSQDKQAAPPSYIRILFYNLP